MYLVLQILVFCHHFTYSSQPYHTIGHSHSLISLSIGSKVISFASSFFMLAHSFFLHPGLHLFFCVKGPEPVGRFCRICTMSHVQLNRFLASFFRSGLYCFHAKGETPMGGWSFGSSGALILLFQSGGYISQNSFGIPGGGISKSVSLLSLLCLLLLALKI